jgi:hypothetical protein
MQTASLIRGYPKRDCEPESSQWIIDIRLEQGSASERDVIVTRRPLHQFQADASRRDAADGGDGEPASDECSQVLFNTLHADPASLAYRLVNVMSRLENAGFVLVWSHSDARPSQLARIAVVELPRLQLSFVPLVDNDGELRLSCVQHPGLFVSDTRSPELQRHIRSIPHCLVLENDSKCVGRHVCRVVSRRVLSCAVVTSAPYSVVVAVAITHSLRRSLRQGAVCAHAQLQAAPAARHVAAVQLKHRAESPHRVGERRVCALLRLSGVTRCAWSAVVAVVTADTACVCFSGALLLYAGARVGHERFGAVARRWTLPRVREHALPRLRGGECTGVRCAAIGVVR